MNQGDESGDHTVGGGIWEADLTSIKDKVKVRVEV